MFASNLLQKFVFGAGCKNYKCETITLWKHCQIGIDLYLTYFPKKRNDRKNKTKTSK